MSKHKKGKNDPKFASLYYDPAWPAKKRRQDKALQRRFNRLAGPVTVRKVGDPKPDQEQE